MIDLHSHILPAIDDGSASVEESEKLLQMLCSQGVTTVVATPHFYANSDYPEIFLEKRARAFAALPPCQSPQILLGAEVAYFDGMGHCQELEQMQLGQSGLLLVEMPFTPWSERMVEEVCQLQISLGLRPVLAHIDRYMDKKQIREYCDVLLDNEVYFQCNADAFRHPLKRRWLLKQLQAGNIHFLGSDCHNLQNRPPRLDQASEVIARKLGEKTLKQLDETARTLLKLQ